MTPTPTLTMALALAEQPAPTPSLRYRECELKHGRVAMLACFGMITAGENHRWSTGPTAPHSAPLPSDELPRPIVGFADAISVFPRVFKDFSSNPLMAATQVPKLGWLQILTFIMFIEVLGVLNSRRPDYEPGNFLGTSQVWSTPGITAPRGVVEPRRR